MTVRAARIARVLLLGSAAALLSPAPASAHLRTGTVAVGYEAAVTSPQSGVFSVGVYRSDLALHLTVRTGHTVVVHGYLGEAFLRLGPAGVSVNDGSPTAAAAGLLAKGAPHGGWTLRRGARSATWHDARVSQLRPGRRSAAWTIPLRVDGRAANIVGTTRRLPAPALWPWLALLVLVALAAFLLARLHGASEAAVSLGAIAAAAGALTAIAFALDSYASPGTWIAGIDELVFIAAGAGLVARGPATLRVGAAIWLGLLGLAIGLSKGEIFFHEDVLSVLPASPSRAVAAIAIGAGAAGSALGGAVLAGLAGGRR